MQNRYVKNEAFVNSFFEDIFISQKPLGEIADNYRYKGAKIRSQDQAIEMFQNYLIYLKNQNKNLLKKDVVFKTEHYYNSSNENLLIFEKKDKKHTYVVTVNDKVVTYVLLKKGKILSFLYFGKGSDYPRYFIPYYLKQDF